MVAITNIQLEALKNQLDKLFADKTKADATTSASNEADEILRKAQEDADAKEAAEVDADDKVNKAILELQSLVNSLVASKLTPAAK